jgi:hypothetical protein
MSALGFGVTSTSSSHILLGNSNTGNSNNAWGISEGLSATQANFANAPKAGQPCFLGMTNNGTNLIGYSRISFRPRLDIATLGVVATGTANSFRAGNSVYDGTDYFDGALWNVRLWDRVLTAAEMLAESYSPYPVSTKNLNLWWPLDTRQKLIDASGRNHPPSVSGTMVTAKSSSVGYRDRSRARTRLRAKSGGVSDVVITTITGNAVANGVVAAVNRSIPAGVGNATADGITVAVIRVVATTTGNAVADGTLAALNRSIPAGVGNAVANGVTAFITQTIATTTGNAVADGVTAAVNRIIASGVGNAVADGTTATIVTGGQTTITCTVGNAVADGVTAAINRSIPATTGNAVADGTLAAVSRIVSTVTGNAVADGVTAAITGSITILCQPGNAVADGVTALITGAPDAGARFGGFEMVGDKPRRPVPEVYKKPLLQRIMEARQAVKDEAVAAAVPERKNARRKAREVEETTAKLVLEGAADAKFAAMLAKWESYKPALHEVDLTDAITAYDMFMARVADQVMRMQDGEAEDEAIVLELIRSGII